MAGPGRVRPPPRSLGVQPPRRGGAPEAPGRARRQARLPGDRAHRPRQHVRRDRLLPARAGRRDQAHPGLRALHRPRQPVRARPGGRPVRGREPRHRARAERDGLPQPDQARLEGLPRGVLLQAAGRQGASGPARRRPADPVRVPQLRGVAAAPGRGGAQGPGGRRLVRGRLRAGPLLHGGPGPRPRRSDQGDRRHAPHRPRARGGRRGHERLPLPRGDGRPRPRGAPVSPDRRQDLRPQPVEVRHRGVLPEVRGGDGQGLRASARGLRGHAGGGRALQPRADVRPVPAPPLRGPPRPDPGLLSPHGGRGRPPAALPRPVARDPRPVRLRARASSRRCSSPATSWWSGTSSGTRRSRGSRSGRAEARRQPRWSPTASGLRQ